MIRLAARVLGASFPGSRIVAAVERSVSWLAWIAVVLWVTGVSPMVLEAMDEVQWKVGNARISLRKRKQKILNQHANKLKRARQ